MPSAPALLTPRLTLRAPTAADRDDWVRLHRDPRTYTHAPHAMAATDEAAVKVFEDNLKHWEAHSFGYWVVRERVEGAVMGACGLKKLRGDDGADFLNLYYRITFDHLGRGFGKELARACAAHATEYLSQWPVRALVGQNNAASIATAEAAGLARVGTHRITGDPDDWPEGLVFAGPRVEAVSTFGAGTREQVLDLWVRTNDAGGSVGFLPGASRERVDAALSAHEESMAAGATIAVVLRSAADADVIGLAFLVPVGTPLMPHVASVYRVMTDPTTRGRNLGRLLMAGVHRVARDAGIEILTLGVRSGSGTSAFYEACGYREAGRVLGAIRVAPGDDRDDITMTRRLDHQTREPDPRN